jgi:hypothetical protein
MDGPCARSRGLLAVSMPHVLYAAEARLYRPGPVANPLVD